MPKMEMTPELKRELQVLKMRSVLDPKRHYRKENTKALPTVFQVGTLFADEGLTGAGARSSTKKADRAQSIVEELLADQTRRDYFKRKTAEIDAKKRSGGKRFYKGIQDRRKQSWQR